MITFESVSKLYPGGTQAVTDLDLEIPTGSFTVLVGPSGCGKTTSMRMINRMVTPTGGRVLIDGQDVAGIRAVTLRLGIGYVLQNAGLFPHRTVLDNVATVQRLLGLSKAQARAKAHEAMERVGLDASMATRYPAQLSGGQQQRVGVARALAADPPILLMDEPFSAVDPIVRLELQQEVRAPAGGDQEDHRDGHPRHRRGADPGRPDRGAGPRRGAPPICRRRSSILTRPADRLRRLPGGQGPRLPHPVLRHARATWHATRASRPRTPTG